MRVKATGDIYIQTVLEPLAVLWDVGDGYSPTMFTHTDDTSLSIQSSGGDIQLQNFSINLFDRNSNNVNVPIAEAGEVYPASLRVVAFEGEILSNYSLYQLPATHSDLEFLAEGDIRIARVFQSRLPVALLPRAEFPLRAGKGWLSNNLATNYISSFYHYAGYLGLLQNPEELQLANDFDPSRVYSLNGTIGAPVVQTTADLLFGYYANEAVEIIAGRDIRGISFNLHNNRASDVSLVRAGVDILVNANAEYRGSIGIFGPGALVVEAGRDIYFTPRGGQNPYVVSAGTITSLGNAHSALGGETRFERALPAEGADIIMMAGVGAGGDYASFAAYYLDPANLGAMPDYLRGQLASGEAAPVYFADAKDAEGVVVAQGLVSFVAEMTGQTPQTAAEAWTMFQTLPELTQHVFLRRVMTEEVRATNRANAGQAFSDQDHQRGYDAIARLFPGQGSGGIYSTNFTVQTQRGGDIEMYTPHGEIQVASLGAGVPAGAGVITRGTGDIRMIARDDVTVNRSRVLTFEGGDVIIGSRLGDVDAGRGAKTTRSALSPEVFTDVDGNTFISERADLSGSGIGTVRGFGEVEPGDVDLWAPGGVVNAGDAGIRVSGNLYIAAVQVLGADNIDVEGEAFGVPQEAPPNVELNLEASATTAAAAAAADQPRDERSVVSVIFEGFGEADAEGEDECPPSSSADPTCPPATP